MTLPTHYLITPKAENSDTFFTAVERSLQAGTRLLQLKGKGVAPDDYATIAQHVITMAHEHGARVLLSGDPAQVESLGADGLHLDSKGLKGVDSRPLAEGYLVAVSGHDVAALKKGESIGADLAVLSPVNYTSAHPDIEPLGWEGFGYIVSQLAIPVYALGGVSSEDEAAAISAGGQGVAGNKGYWKG